MSDGVTRVTQWARALELLRGVREPTTAADPGDELTGWTCLEVDGEPEAYEHRTGGRVWLNDSPSTGAYWTANPPGGPQTIFVPTEEGRLGAMARAVGIVVEECRGQHQHQWRYPPSADVRTGFATFAEAALDALRWRG